MRLPERPSPIRLVSLSKSYLEDRLGIALGDAVNLALFILTIISLFIALAGIGIAWITYKSADEGGKTQERLLNSAADSLQKAQASLDASNKQLTELHDRMQDLNDRMKQSISIAASQQENLNSAVSISKRQLAELKQTQEISAGQLDLLKKQTEMLSRTPNAWMTAYCEPVRYDTVHRVSAFVPPREKSQYRNETLWTNGKGEVTCQILIENGGNANLTNAAARLKIEPLLVGQKSDPHPPFSISYSLEDERRVQRLPAVIAVVTDQHSTIVLMEGQTISPSSGLWSLQLQLTVPQEIRVMNLIWQFGGNEQNFPDDQVTVAVNRLPEEP